MSKGEEAEVPSGTTFGIQLKQGLTIREGYISESASMPDPPVDQPAGAPDRTDRRDSRPDSTDRSVPERVEPESRIEPDPADSLPLSSPEMVRRAQGALKDQGYYEGEADGVMSARTSGALRTYQREHNLPQSGDLDPQTARSLGIVGRPAARDREPPPAAETRTESAESSATVLANVLSANASRTSDGGVYVSINTQANTGGWRWYEEHLVNADTLEVYARAVRPTGMVTQVITRGRVEVTVRDGAQYLRRVVVHGAGGDQEIPLERSSPSGRTEPARDTGALSGTPASSAAGIQRKADDLLSEYQRIFGVRMTGSGVQLENAAQYREPEIELLFAIDSFANAAQLYTRLVNSLVDRQSLRGATLAMAKQARRTDRVIATTTSRSTTC